MYSSGAALAPIPGRNIEPAFRNWTAWQAVGEGGLQGTPIAGHSETTELSMNHQLLNPHEAAEVLKMDSRTLVRWARIGYVPAHPLGEGKRKLWRFLENELLDWVEAQGKHNQKRPPASSIETAIGVHARRTA